MTNDNEGRAMNDTPGDDAGQSDIPQQDLISDDVASAITSAINGEEMEGSTTPATTIKPSQPKSQPPPAQPQSQQNDEGPAKDQPAASSQPTTPQPPSPRIPADHPQITDRGSGNVSELYDIKQEALKRLSPLVQHLELGPKERFETLLMMLRASDDPALIRPAYEAAQAIEDEKQRAQALLDVVHEVNYLTRPADVSD